MKKCYLIGGTGERFLLTISSAATIDDFTATLTAETGGHCLGPADWEGDESEIARIRAEWDHLEEMSEEEIADRIAHLAEEWDLAPEDLTYLI